MAISRKHDGKTMANSKVINFNRHVPKPEQVYREDIFNIPAKDHHGHYEPLRFNLPPHLFDAVMRAVKNEDLPFRDIGGFCRAGVKLLLDLCAKLDPDLITDSFKQNTILINILTEEQRNMEFTLIFEKMRSQVDELIRHGAKNHAMGMLLRILNVIREMDMGFYKNQYLGELRKQFGNMLDEYGINWETEMTAPVGLGDFAAIGQDEEV